MFQCKMKNAPWVLVLPESYRRILWNDVLVAAVEEDLDKPGKFVFYVSKKLSYISQQLDIPTVVIKRELEKLKDHLVKVFVMYQLMADDKAFVVDLPDPFEWQMEDSSMVRLKEKDLTMFSVVEWFDGSFHSATERKRKQK